MTISAIVPKHVYNGNDATTEWPILFPYDSTADLKFYLTDPDGLEAELLSRFELDEDNGVLIFPQNLEGQTPVLPPLADGWKLTIGRVTPRTQTLNVASQGSVPGTVIEKEFDKLTMMVQDLGELISRAVKFPVSSTPSSDDTESFLSEIDAAKSVALTAASNAATSQADAQAAAAMTVAAATSAADSASIATTRAADAATSATDAANSAAAATNPANITQDANHRFATDAEKTLWDARDALKIKGVVINDAAKADKKVLQYDLATDRVIYADAAGGGGGGSLQWVETSSAPISDIENDMRVFKFQQGLTQQMFTLIRVPLSYLAGKQIKLHVPWYAPDSSGTAKIATYGSLFKPGLTSMGGNPGNVDVSVTATLAAGTVDKLQVTTLALTDASGQCAGIAVAPGDLIKLYISRGADTAASDMRVLAYAAEVTFQ